MVKTSASGGSLIHSSRSLCVDLQWAQQLVGFANSDNVLMVDDCEWKNVLNGNNSCYFPKPWKGEMQLPNPWNVIPDVCIALLPFIMDLVHFDSVAEFLQSTPMDGKFRRRSLSEWHSSRVEQ